MSRETVYCPICWKPIWSHSLEPYRARASIPSRADSTGIVIAMIQAAQADAEETRRIAEEAAEAHFAAEHAFRLWLARRLGRNGPLRRRWPWSRVSNLERLRVPMKGD